MKVWFFEMGKKEKKIIDASINNSIKKLNFGTKSSKGGFIAALREFFLMRVF